MKLEITRALTAKSTRVYCVDWHPTEPWILSAHASGYVNVNNYEIHAQIQKLKVCELPVRAAKFVHRMNWIVTGSDDRQIRIFDYNTRERVHSFKAHEGFVRCIVVHPTQPYIITCSDDMPIRLWNWELNWDCQQVFQGHTRAVTQIAINPTDTNTFASASLDTTVKVWQLGSSDYNFSLEGHEKGVNCVDYYHARDQPFIISGGNDHLVKIWDYQKKTCVETIHVDSENVSSVGVHSKLPILLIGFENGLLSMWHMGTFDLMLTLRYGSESIWTISSMHGSNTVAFGFSEGAIALNVEREEAAISMDAKECQIIWVNNLDLMEFKLNKKLLQATQLREGEVIPMTGVDMGSCKIYPNSIAHNPDGQLVTLYNDDEYVIYSAKTLHIVASGKAQQFAWALGCSYYATLQDFHTIKIYKDFKVQQNLRSYIGVKGIFGGGLLGIQFYGNLPFCFVDWERHNLIHWVPPTAVQHVLWSESGDLVCLANDKSYFVLKYNEDVVARARATRAGAFVNAFAGAFELVNQVNETVTSGVWVGDCFIYIDSFQRIKYNVCGVIVTIAQHGGTMHILGYVREENRLFLNDNALNIVSYSLSLSVLEFQSAIMRGDFETADRVLPTVAHEQRTRVAHFLEEQGLKQQALDVSTDPKHQFELALSLGHLRHAMQILYSSETDDEEQSNSAAARWSRLGSAAVVAGDYELTKICYQRAEEYGSLLVFAILSENTEVLKDVAQMASVSDNYIVAFIAYYILNDMEACLQLLISKNSLPEALYFARTYIPSKMEEVVKLVRHVADFKTCRQSVKDAQQYKYCFADHTDTLSFAKFVKRIGYVYRDLRVSPGTFSVDLARNILFNGEDETVLDLSTADDEA